MGDKADLAATSLSASAHPVSNSVHKIDADVALEATKHQQDAVTLDAATNQRLVRKIDLMLMPVSHHQELLPPQADPRTSFYVLFMD